MKPFTLLTAFAAAFLASTEAFAQKETFDVVTFDPPAGWAREVKDKTYTCYTTTNPEKGVYCRIFIMLSLPSKGGLKEDFENDWKNLIAGQYELTAARQAGEPRTEQGWQIIDARAPFTYAGKAATAMLTTMTGGGRTTSIVAVTSSDDYLPDIRRFLASIELKKPAAADVPAKPAAGKFAFVTTNFDDGWTSTAQDDWVEVAKGTTRVLIHYPDKKVDAYNPDLLAGLKNAWAVLVAPRYGTMTNLAFRPVSGWESVEFAEADAVAASTGKAVHVVLFKKNYSGGQGRFLEFITPDTASFEREFGKHRESSSGWEKMEDMATRNKFAVAASDLAGKWTSNFSGVTQYVNAATGLDAGMDTHASVENFLFGPGTSYQWELAVANGPVGQIKFQSVKSAGDFSLPTPWQVAFTDIEGKPRTYDASFACIKGLRILRLGSSILAKGG